MTPDPSIAQALERQSVVVMDCTIPAEMSIEDWRRLRSERRRSASSRSSRLRATARRVVPLRPEPCDHLHDTTTRYDHDSKQLSFLQVCHACGTEKVVETIPYEPRFTPHPAPEAAGGSGGATIHQLPVRPAPRPLRRAA
jgi:hypothetical protein